MRHLAPVISDFEIGCLETDRESFYARFSWEVWRGPLAGRSGTELLPTPDQKGIMILRLARTPAFDLDRLLVIEYNGRIWQLNQRSATRAWFGPRAKYPCRLIALTTANTTKIAI